MKMLTPETGWAETGNTLWWTEDGGTHWKNITPDPFVNSERSSNQVLFHDQPEALASISFLDTQTGWVLLCCGKSDPDTGDDLPHYDLAATTDAGATWSIARVKIPPNAVHPMMDSYSGEVAFADPVHGWMMTIETAGHSAGGVLLITSDGGRTWRLPQSEPPGGAYPFSLVTPSLGWQVTIPNPWVGDDEGPDLYVTRDGARNWQDVTVPIPKHLLGVPPGGPSPTASYDLPTFDRQNLKHGFLVVTYQPQESNAKSTLVLFETNDGGHSWKPIRTIENLPSDEESIPADVVDSTLIAAKGSYKDKTVTLIRSGPDGKSETDISSYFPGRRRAPGPVSMLSFSSTTQGWMLGLGKLFSTVDGGTTWKELQPQPHEELIGSLRSTPWGNSIDVMQLLTNDLGWALSTMSGKLLWTENGGSTWKEITPSKTAFGYAFAPGASTYHQIISAFFLNDRQGWALASDAVYCTVDSGAHWSMTDLVKERLVDLSQVTKVSSFPVAVGSINFSDPLHGWVSLAPTRVSDDRTRWLLTTSDAGRTWRHAPSDPGYAGLVRALSPDKCWVRSFDGDTLSVTRDGAKTWENIALVAPKGIEPWRTIYDLPIFKDNQHGFLSVTYPDLPGPNGGAVLFATNDGGLTWKPNRTLADLDIKLAGGDVSSTLVGDDWITANIAGHNDPTLTTILPGATVSSTSNTIPSYYGSRQLSFVTPSRGWILLSDKRFLSTSDAGATWTELTPPLRAQAPIIAPDLGAWSTQGATQDGHVRER